MSYTSFGWTSDQLVNDQPRQTLFDFPSRASKSSSSTISTKKSLQPRNSPSEPSPAGSRAEPNSRLRVPPILPIFVVASGAYFLYSARVRARSRITALRSARDRAAGESAAWKTAYFRARENLFSSQLPPTWAGKKRQRGISEHMLLKGGFISENIARKAEEEQRNAFSGGVFDDVSRSAARLAGMSTGRLDPFSDNAVSPRSGDRVHSGSIAQQSSDNALRSTEEPHSKKRSSERCESTATVRQSKVLDARTKWQRASGVAIHRWDEDEIAAWANQAHEKAQQAKELYKLKYLEMSSAHATEDARLAASMHKQQALQRLRFKQKPAGLDHTMLDELDATFYEAHAKKEQSYRPETDQRSRGQSTALEKPEDVAALKLTARPKHFSMDNLFLEAQTEDAAAEGREAQQQRLQRDQRNPRSMSVRSKLRFAPDVSARDTVATELFGTFGVSAGAEFEAENSDNNETQSAPELSPASEENQNSFLLAALEHATREGQSIRRSQQQRRKSSSGADATKQFLQEDRKWRAMTGIDAKPESDTKAETMKMDDSDGTEYRKTDLKRSTTSNQLFPEGSLRVAEEHNQEVNRVEKKIRDLSFEMKSVRDQVGKMNVWADEVHRKLGYHGRYPGSRDIP